MPSTVDRVRGAALAAVLLLAAAPAEGQEPGFTIVGGLTYAFGGPGPALVSAFEDIGYGDLNLEACTGGNVCADAVEYPFHSDQGLNVGAVAGVEYRFDAPFSVEALVTQGQRGYAEGYDDASRERVVVDYSSFTLSTTVNVHYGPLRLAVGPALNRAVWQVTRNADRDSGEATWTAGGLALLSAEVPTDMLKLSFRAGARGFSAADLGEFTGLALDPAYATYFVGALVKFRVD